MVPGISPGPRCSPWPGPRQSRRNALTPTPVRGLLKRHRDCRWEEAKVGLVQKPGELDRLYSVLPTSELERSFDDLFSLACMKGWSEQTQVRGIADGTRHIRPRMESVFNTGDFKFILDRPHCKEHLSGAGEALEPLTGVPAQTWAGQALEKLEAGDTAAVVIELERAWESSGPDEKSRIDTLRREAGYFERNQDAVAYATRWKPHAGSQLPRPGVVHREQRGGKRPPPCRSSPRQDLWSVVAPRPC